MGQKFARNRSISYGFRDIATFSFSAKIKDGRQKWRKLKFHPFAYETLVPPCGSKIRSKSLYLLQFSRCWHFFIFRKNPRWPPKVAKIEISPFAQDTPVPPCGSKIRRNRSISYRFPDIDTFPFSAKNPRWLPKIEIFPLCTRDSCTTLWFKNSLKIALSLTVFEILTLFYFPLKSKMAAESDENWISPLSPKDYCTTLWVKNSLEIALSLTVFEILTLFHFPQKSKMAAKSGENWNFPNLHRTLLYLPVGQKFARTRSISYRFRDIDTFSFSAKIQDGHRKWRKSKFSPFAQQTLVPPCGSKICSKSLHLLQFSRYWHFFIFRENPRWPPKVAKIEVFPLSTGHSYTTLWVNFARNRSISYGFRDVNTFSFSTKIQDGRQKWRKLKFTPFQHDTLVPLCGSKIRSKSLYLLPFSRYWHFFIFH